MDLRDYIRGERRGKEANRLERKAMDDPFLRDAIDGYDLVEGDHIATIEYLEKRLSSPRKRTNRRIWLWAAAAVIILLTGIPLLLHKPKAPEEMTVASSDIIRQEKETAPLLPEDDTLLAASRHETKRQDSAPRTRQTPTPSLPEDASTAKTERAEERIEPAAARIVEVADDVKNVTDTGIRLSAGQLARGRTVTGEPASAPTTPTDKLLVSGRIVDETGEPITGVSIREPNTNTGTVSDIHGNFRLILPDDKQEKLIASYIGLKNTEIPLKENMGDIVMISEDMALYETVVTRPGAAKKRLSSGSASPGNKGDAFGEEEFRDYFAEHYDKDICAGQDMTVVVTFFIDPAGRPAHIDIRENPCPALENEIKRLLLGSPLWSDANRKVTLRIELP